MDGSVPNLSSVYEACARLQPSYLMLWPPTAAAMMTQPPPKEYDLSSVVGVVPIGSSVTKLFISFKSKTLIFLSSALYFQGPRRLRGQDVRVLPERQGLAGIRPLRGRLELSGRLIDH